MPSGGPRRRTAASNMGRPAGTTGIKHASTITKEQARDVVRQLVIANLQPMLRAQMAHAQGIGHVFTRDKAGKFTKIEDAERAEQLLTEGEEGKDYWIFMKDPSVQAFTDLLNRALDKPKEQAQEVNLTVELVAVSDRLLNARKRLALKRGKG